MWKIKMLARGFVFWLVLNLSLALICTAQNASIPASAPSPSSSVATDSKEAYYMRHLRYSLRIRDFYWRRTADPCTWRGVDCENGHIVGILLYGLKRNAKGMANPTFQVDQLTGLPYLRSFNATRFVLLGSIPELFGSLSSLQILDLTSCSINGSIPHSLGNLTTLNFLSLSTNNLAGAIPASFGNFTNLTSIDISDNQLSGNIPQEIGKCQKLSTLKLNNNSLNGSIPENVLSILGLQQLDLSTNNLTGALPSSFSNLTNLQTANFSNNQLYGLLPEGLSQWKNITVLDLSSNYFNGTVPSVSGSKTDQNCFTNAQKQRSNETCTSFYARLGLQFTGFSGAPAPSPSVPAEGSKSSKHLGAILGGVFGGLGLVLAVILIVYLFIQRDRVAQPKSSDPVPPAAQPGATTQPNPVVGVTVNLSSIGEAFSFSQLENATQLFSSSNLIKSGHSGDIYRGLLDGSVPIIVKRVVVSKVKKELLIAELEIVSKASHTRLIPLLGHCLEREDEKLLVYKYMPYGDLAQALHKRIIPSPPEDILQSLDWITRLKIAIGVAEGLTYLHHECTPPLVHRDIKATSILLDDKYEVRLGSLSEARAQEGDSQPGLISRILRLSQTAEQSDPDSPVASCAYDVFCFGKVLLELVSGKLGISDSNDTSADDWIDSALRLIDRHDKDSLTKLLDPSLIVDEDLLEEVWAMAIIAKLCLNPKPSKRPQIRHILKALEYPQKVTREENLNSSLRSRHSSYGSWNASLFGSWRHSSEHVIIPGTLREEYSLEPKKQSGTSHSQGSMPGESFHKRPGSNEIFPEPLDDVQPNPFTLGSDRQEG